MTVKLVIDESLQRVDLKDYAPYVAWSPGAAWFNAPPGNEHYRLLAHLSAQLPKYAQVADCGTLYGCSAVALASNASVTVHTFDIQDRLAGPGEIIKSKPNIFFHQQDCVAAVPEILAGVQPLVIVLDIDPHDGKQETDFLVQLELHSYRGILICDDIHLNDQMKKFWTSVQSCFREQLERRPAYKCIDATQYGHWSGTGIVVFDPETIDMEVKS